MLKAALTVLLLSISAAAVAAAPGGISISPVLLKLNAGQASIAVTVRNDTDQTKVFQADPVSWRHQDGADVLQATPAIIASPPLFRLAPGARQVLRVGLADAPAAQQNEKTYRIFLQEIPDQSVKEGGTQLRMLLRFGLPLFIAPDKPAPESLVWHARRRAAGIELEVTNIGNVHARLSELAVTPQGTTTTLPVDGFVYVFAGESHHWTLTPPKNWSGTMLKRSVRTDQGVSSADLPLEGG